jgi:hypothetical protein
MTYEPSGVPGDNFLEYLTEPVGRQARVAASGGGHPQVVFRHQVLFRMEGDAC